MPKVKENNCTCLQCGSQFYRSEYYIKHGMNKYCSKECADKSKRNGAEYVCPVCGVTFYRKSSEANRNYGIRYCSSSCYNSNRNHKTEKICKTCGKSFYSYSDSSKYCSSACRDMGFTTKTSRNCLVCHKPFYVKPHQIIRGHGRFCSMKCWHEFNRGDNHPQWNAEMTDEERAIRNGLKRDLPEYKNWRRNVFTRDNYTCRACGARGVRLNAHHIIPWSVDVSLRYEISNGITLCESCHKKEHKRLKKLKEFQRDLFIS